LNEDPESTASGARDAWTKISSVISPASAAEDSKFEQIRWTMCQYRVVSVPKARPSPRRIRCTSRSSVSSSPQSIRITAAFRECSQLIHTACRRLEAARSF